MQSESVFKAYDIRGRADLGEINPELYAAVGSAVVALLDCDEVAVGRDCRASSPALFAGLSDGIMRAGAEVIDLGEIPTDAVYYYSGANEVAGAMITASHNPAEYNGLKLCRPGAAPIGEETGLSFIKERVMAGEEPSDITRGSMRRVNVIDPYIEHVLQVSAAESIGELDVAVDGGNGMAGVVVERVFARTRAHLSGIYLELDGSFPNHPADPLVLANLADLQALMSSGDYDLGVAFDGDADRAFFLDENGAPLSGSTVTSLIARKMLATRGPAPVVHNLITSRAVPEIIMEAGGTPVKTRVGHSYIKQVMAETGAIFGGEHSGHYYFRDNFRADSGMLATLVLLGVLSESGKPMSLLRQEVERYASSGEINFEVDHPQRALARVENEFDESRVDHLDGLTVDLDEGWFNLRPSNTEPLLRLNVEGPDEETVERIVGRVSAMLGGR
jgi:phosphomannomutase